MTIRKTTTIEGRMKTSACTPCVAFASLIGLGSASAYAEPLTIPVEQEIPIAAIQESAGSVAVDDGVLVIGGPRSPGLDQSGSVYIYTRAAAPDCPKRRCWVLDRELQRPEGPHAGDFFGHAVALNDETLAISARSVVSREDEAVYVYARHGKQFATSQRLTGDQEGALPFDRTGFGHAISLDGDRLAVSSLGESDIPNPMGATYVFKRRANGEWRREAKLRPANATFGGGQYGYSVSLDDERLVVGADIISLAYVFERHGNQWHEAQTLMPWDDASEFGRNVAIEGRRLVVGAYFATNSTGGSPGAAYLFQRQDGTWVPEQKFEKDDGTAFDAFGAALVMHGDKIAVVGGNGIYVYERQAGFGTYELVAKLTSPARFSVTAAPLTIDWSGHTLAVVGNGVVDVFNMKALETSAP